MDSCNVCEKKKIPEMYTQMLVDQSHCHGAVNKL